MPITSGKLPTVELMASLFANQGIKANKQRM